MTVPTLRRPASVWQFFAHAIAALTSPRADVRACDRRVAALAADSALGRVIAAGAAMWRRSVAGSTMCRRCAEVVRGVSVLALPDRVRATAACAAAAAATVLALRPLTTERDPLTWALPSAVLGIAALAFVLSPAIARAIEHYHE